MSRKALLAVLVVAVLLAAAGAWYFLLRDDAPPEVDIGSATAGLTSTTASGGSATTDGEISEDLSGSWVVDGTVGSFEDFTSTFAGYRVEEELADIGANTAVGRTPDVTGSLDIAGSTITAVGIEVDMTTLESDESRRDNQLRGRGLETDTYPTATFSLAEPIELAESPEPGVVVEVTAVGELTLHGVTQEVRMPLEATLEGGLIVVTGSLDVSLADYQIEAPTGFHVLTVGDVGTVELQLFFSRA